MDLKIYVFNSQYASRIINSMDQLYPVLYSNNSHDFEWFKLNCVNGKLYYIFENVIHDYNANDCSEDFYLPHFMLIFNNDYATLDTYGWSCLLQYFNFEIMDSTDFDIKCIRKAQDLLKKIDIVHSDNKYLAGTTSIEPLNESPEYEFDFIVKNDVAFYVVSRSNLAKPIVVVVDKFNGDHLQFFYGLYSCRDWDSNRLHGRYDFDFTAVVWNKLEMPGTFDINIINDNIKKANLNPDDYFKIAPKLYRKDVKEVIGNYFSKKRSLDVPYFISKKAK